MSTSAIFGRYWAADSPLHNLDPRTKILGTLILVITLFCANNFYSLAFVCAFILMLIPLSKIPILQVLKSIAPLLFIVILTALFNLVFIQGGAIYIDWGWLQISQEGITRTIFICIRLTFLLLSGSLLTLTTTSMDITEGFERLLTPFSKIGLPAHEFAFVLGTALRFLPQFADEFKRIRAAQIARGAKLRTSPLRNGMSTVTSLLVPLFTSVFRHADTLSAAMEARCYHGANGRTRLHPLVFGKGDILAIVLLAFAFAATIALT